MINAHSIKMTMQKARRRIGSFIKSFKSGKLDKSKTSSYTDMQSYLKSSNKKFRRYNRKIGAYEPIIPRGKLKQSDEFEQFVLDINQYMNETRTAKEEIERKEFKKEWNLSDDILNLMDIQSIDYSEYSSDSENAKQLHLDNAMGQYDIDLNDVEQMRKIRQISNHLNDYDIKDIYDAVFSIKNTKESGAVFNEI